MSIKLVKFLPKTIRYIIPLLTCTFIYTEATAAVQPPTGENTFLALLERNVTEDANSSTAYYNTIDPNGDSATYAGWLVEAGFINSVSDYNSSGILNESTDSAKVLYRNRTDLGFVRRVRARCEPSCDAPNPDLYAIIENYANFDNALARVDRLASVTMEWTAAADGSNPSEKFVKFYAYTGSTNPAVPADMREIGGVPFAPDLDGRGNKEVPGLCNSCHGGAPEELNDDGSYADNGNTAGLFIPSDLDNYDYDPRPGLTRADQEAEFKKMNDIALVTHRGKKKYDEEAGISRNPAVQELIEGWYGRPGALNAVFDGEFVPAGWLPPAAPVEAKELYLKAIAPACRACHAQQKRELDFATYKGFMVFEDAHKELVLRIECGLDDDNADRGDGSDDQAVMPLAKETFEIFWNREPEQAQYFKELVGDVNCEDYD